MANTRFITNNWITESGAVLKNGTGGGAPALIEVAPYVMANLRLGDRYTVWKSPVAAGISADNIDFTFAAARTVRYVGLHGYRVLTPSVSPLPFVDVYGQSGAYNAAGVWTYLVTLPLDVNGRDVGVDLDPFGANYNSVRFEYNSVSIGTQISLGTPWAANVVDTGIIHSPGATFAAFRNRLETPLPNGAMVVTDLGDEGGEFVLPFRTINSTLRDQLLALKNVAGSFILLDAEGQAYEVILRNGTVMQSRRLRDLYDVDLTLTRLP